MVKPFSAKSRLFAKSSESDFLTFKTRSAFTEPKPALIKILISHHFDPECHICIETNVSNYTIDRVFN